jgi:DNA primase catalytic core
MPLTPREEIDRLKRDISVQRLAEARGIKLRRSGKELIGLCPFHKDTSPSLNITPAENVWQCKGACGERGDVIQWVMRAEGISLRHAVELLRRDYLPSTASATGPPPKQSTVPKLPPLFELTADDRKVLAVVVDHYHETLKDSPDSLKAKQYLFHRGLQPSEMIEHFRLGLSNRTLSYHLPDKNRAVGAAMRGRLEKLGILRQKSGHEHFNGSLVVPIFNLQGEVVEIYGRKITRITALRNGTPAHLYLPGPHRGVWNEEALIPSKEIILCEALIDALTFWCANYQNVTSIYGTNGFTDDHRAAFKKHGTKKIYIAYDRDEAGERAAQEHAAELMALGIECFRVQFPKGMDANEYARMTQPATKALGMLLHRAAWLGIRKRPMAAVTEPAASATQTGIEEVRIEPAAQPKIPEPVPSLAAEPEEPATVAKDNISEIAAAKANELPVEINGYEIKITLGDRRYRVLNLEKNTTVGALLVNLLVTRGEGLACGHLRFVLIAASGAVLQAGERGTRRQGRSGIARLGQGAVEARRPATPAHSKNVRTEGGGNLSERGRTNGRVGTTARSTLARPYP